MANSTNEHNHGPVVSLEPIANNGDAAVVATIT